MIVVVVGRRMVVGLFRVVGGGVGVVTAARFQGGGGRRSRCVSRRLHSLVDEVQVLCQTEHSDQRCHILVDILLFQQLHLTRNGAIDPGGHLVGQPSDGLASVQHGIGTSGHGSWRMIGKQKRLIR